MPEPHPVDFQQLADWCGEAGCSMLHRQQIMDANTARQVLELLSDDPDRPRLIKLLIQYAKKAAEEFSGGQCAVDYAVFDFDGTRLG